MAVHGTHGSFDLKENFNESVSRSVVSEVAKSCLTLCDPMDCSPLASSVHRILQARILEWVAISSSRESACNAGDLGLIPGLGRCPEEGNGSPLQHSYLENSKDRGAWRATVHGVAKSRPDILEI